MARIRTIKPEFPQSETVGRLSRDARLLFIQLWTLVDDEGRARAASRMLASLLYPYDEDAPKLMEAWLDELEQKGCIRRYEADGSHYLDIPNWLKHQKIDRPSPSKIPEYREPSTNPRECSRALDADLDLGPVSRTKDIPAPNGAALLFEKPSEPPDPSVAERDYFKRCRQVLGEKSGGGLGARLLKSKGGNVALARAGIEQASTKSKPAEYVGRLIHGQQQQSASEYPAGIV